MDARPLPKASIFKVLALLVFLLKGVVVPAGGLTKWMLNETTGLIQKHESPLDLSLSPKIGISMTEEAAARPVSGNLRRKTLRLAGNCRREVPPPPPFRGLPGCGGCTAGQGSVEARDGRQAWGGYGVHDMSEQAETETGQVECMVPYCVVVQSAAVTVGREATEAVFRGGPREMWARGAPKGRWAAAHARGGGMWGGDGSHGAADPSREVPCGACAWSEPAVVMPDTHAFRGYLVDGLNPPPSWPLDISGMVARSEVAFEGGVYTVDVRGEEFVGEPALVPLFDSFGGVDTALQHFQRILDVSTEDAEVWSNRGVANRAKGDYEEASRDFTRALELQERADVYMNAGHAEYLLGRLWQAVELFRKGLQLNDSDMLLHFSLGNTLFELREHAEAIWHLQETLRIDPDFSLAFERLQSPLRMKRRRDRMGLILPFAAIVLVVLCFAAHQFLSFVFIIHQPPVPQTQLQHAAKLSRPHLLAKKKRRG